MSQTETEQLLAGLRAVMRDAEALLKATATQTGEQVQQVRERAEQSLKQARERVAAIPGAVRDSANQAAQAGEEYIKQHPWQSLGMAAGLGLIIGLLLRQRD